MSIHIPTDYGTQRSIVGSTASSMLLTPTVEFIFPHSGVQELRGPAQWCSGVERPSEASKGGYLISATKIRRRGLDVAIPCLLCYNMFIDLSFQRTSNECLSWW